MPTFDSWPEQARDCTATFSFRAYGIRFGLRTNNPPILAQAAQLSYPPLWKPISAAARLDRLFTLRKDATKFRLYENAEQTIATRSRLLALGDLERRMKIFMAEMSPHRVFVHAGVVGWQGRAFLFPGRSFAGKTSLVSAFIKAGATYYSDEYAVLDSRGRVHPYPQPLGIRPHGSARQRPLQAEDLGGVVGTKPLPVGAILFCEYQPGARWRPQGLTTGAAALALLENTVPARRNPSVVLPTLTKAATAAVAFRTKRGEAAIAAQRLLNHLSAYL